MSRETVPGTKRSQNFLKHSKNQPLQNRFGDQKVSLDLPLNTAGGNLQDNDANVVNDFTVQISCISVIEINEIFFFLWTINGITLVSSVTRKLCSKHETQQQGACNILLQIIYHKEKQG